MRTVLHLSRTPLAGAPGRLAEVQRYHCGYDALHFCEADYPEPMTRVLLGSSMLMSAGDNATASVFDEYVRRAHIIHVHNLVSPKTERRILELRPRARFVYHAHSPLREGPLYFARPTELRFAWDAQCCVAQFQNRFFPDALPLPNIVPVAASTSPPATDKLRLMYSPSHRRDGRWNTKLSGALADSIEVLRRREDVEIHDALPPLFPAQLMAIRRRLNVTIDEITTGGFHQTSLEGLIAGNVVINAADEFAIRCMMGWAKTRQRPPFYRATNSDIAARLLDLVERPDLLSEFCEASLDYARSNLQPGDLVEHYVRLYDSITSPS